MKIYANTKNGFVNLTLSSEKEEISFKKEPNFFIVQEVIERDISIPIITETWEDALDAVYELIKMSLKEYEDYEIRDDLFKDMEADRTLTLITGNYVYYFIANGETPNHDSIDWKITPVYAEIN